MKELWREIPGYPAYWVSDKGRVRSVNRWIRQAASHKARAHDHYVQGRLLKPGRNTKQGHVTVSLGRHNSINVHRLVILAFRGPCPKGKEVLHANGKASDNRLPNLRYGTRSENNIDSARMGRRKLTPEKVLKIRAAKKYTAATARLLATRYGVSVSAIRRVWERVNWSWIP